MHDLSQRVVSLPHLIEKHFCRKSLKVAMSPKFQKLVVIQPTALPLEHATEIPHSPALTGVRTTVGSASQSQLILDVVYNLERDCHRRKLFHCRKSPLQQYSEAALTCRSRTVRKSQLTPRPPHPGLRCVEPGCSPNNICTRRELIVTSPNHNDVTMPS